MPTAADPVIVPNTTNDPVYDLSEVHTYDSLEIGSGATLQQTGIAITTINVDNTVTIDGTQTLSTGTLNIDGDVTNDEAMIDLDI